jgi:hypothetical protein
MPRNGANIYAYPPGTEGYPDTTIESTKYNTYIADVAADLNLPRPIVAGGTGADSADEALANLGAEKSSQVVTNYDTHLFLPGSFYSAAGATNAPVTGHAFVGIAMSSDPPAVPPANQNVTIIAYDQGTAADTGRVYIREKLAGVWKAWGLFFGLSVSNSPPTNVAANTLWWDNETGLLYIYYDDGNSLQWVIACPQPDFATYASIGYVDGQDALLVAKAGDTMTGALLLPATPPTLDTEAASKKYVDDTVAAASTGSDFLPLTGGTMTGELTIAAPAFNSNIVMNAPNSTYSNFIYGKRAGLELWRLQLGASTSGDLSVLMFDDAGDFVPGGPPLNISHATGQVTVKVDPTTALGVATKQYVDTHAATKQYVDAKIAEVLQILSTRT